MLSLCPPLITGLEVSLGSSAESHRVCVCVGELGMCGFSVAAAAKFLNSGGSSKTGAYALCFIEVPVE